MATNFQRLVKLARKNSTTILTTSVVFGIFTTSILTGKASITAYKVLEKEELLEAPKKEQVKKVWKHFIIPAAAGLLTIGGAIYSNRISIRRSAALASLLTLSEASLKEYKQKVTETFGKKKEARVQADAYKAMVDKNPTTPSNVIYTGSGDTLCIDILSGRYFKSNIENILKAQNTVNKDLLDDGEITLNDVYYYLKLDSTELGKECVWDVNDGLIEFKFSSILTDGVPCLVVDYEPRPSHRYQDY